MPPSINRQKPPVKQVSFPEGSILASAVPTTTLSQGYTKLCIYGRNRSGKTTLAAQFKKPILVISSEPDENGGADSISDIEGISLIRVSVKKLPGERTALGSGKVVMIARELASNNPFATVVYDTVTSLQDVIHAELLGLPDIPDTKGWGTVPDGFYQQRSEKLKSTIRPIIDLTNCNVIILAQEKDHNSSEDRGGKNKLLQANGRRDAMQSGSFMGPSLGAGTANWLQDACRYVVQIYEDELQDKIEVPTMNMDGTPGETVTQYIPTGKRQRHLRLIYHPNFAAGGRIPFSRNTPEFVTAPTPQGLYKELTKYIPSLKG